MGGNGPQEQRGGHRKGRGLMDERRMEGGRQAWREDRRGGKRIRETERESQRDKDCSLFLGLQCRRYENG